MTSNFLKYLAFVLLLATVWSCNTKKYLSADQAFVTKNKIVIDKDQAVKGKRNLENELYTYLKEKPNTNFLFFLPREKYWFKLQDTLENGPRMINFKKWQMRNFGEEAAIYNKEVAAATSQSMTYYLQNKGYFNAVVTDTTIIKRKEATTIYKVQPNELYVYNKVRYNSADKNIKRLIDGAQKESKIKTGAPVDVDLYNQEVRRITEMMRDTGYAYFSNSYISELSGDSIGRRVDADLQIYLPYQDSLHRRYTVGEIYVYPQYQLNDSLPYQDTLINGIYYRTTDGDLGIRTRALTNSIYLNKGDLYKQSNYSKTTKQLGSLSTYRFVSIKEYKNPDNPSQLDFHIFLTPNKKLELSASPEISTSNSIDNAFLGQRLLGTSVDFSLQNRNALKGGELFVISANAGVDLDVTKATVPDSLINTIDLGINSDLYFPVFIDYLKVWSTLSKIKFQGNHMINPKFYSELYDEGSTRVGAGYSYLRRIGYKNKNRFLLNHAEINYVVPTVEVAFDTTFLDNNQFLKKSFERQLFTGFLFRNMSYNWGGVPNLQGDAFSYNFNLEVSGAEVGLFNAISNIGKADIDKTRLEIELNNGDIIEFAQFVKIDGGIRYFRKLPARTSIAGRLYAGIASPFNFSTDVPYVKQFFVGGPNSVRAWRAREIGPGAHQDEGFDFTAQPFFQSGDLYFEFNTEYRFEIFKIWGIKFDGAAFIDAGNVWTIREDPERLNGLLRWRPFYDVDGNQIGDNFINQLAVGTGIGFRFDFQYAVLRLDGGLKLRNPYPDENGQYWRKWSNDAALSPFRTLNWNIGNE